MIIQILESIDKQIVAESIASVFDQHSIKWNLIDQVNWQEYPYHPKTLFRIAAGKDCFLLQYHVDEDTVRARYDQDNGNVWTDSCVEFFVKPTDEDCYYNCECNCIGTILLGYGADRHNRQLADPEIISQIKRYASMGKLPFEERSSEGPWEVSLVIPFDVFFKSTFPASIKGLTMHANFYKCGDDLITPHFLTWNPIRLPSPDFHCPQFFGEIFFV